MDIENKVRGFIEEKFCRSSGTSVSNEDSLLESGIVDSGGIFELIGFLEKEFNITISDEDIVPDNFENVGFISKLVQSRTS